MKSGDVITHNQLKLYNNYNHFVVAGVLIVFGLLMLWGIPTFPRNLFMSLMFFSLAYVGYRTLKTSKPILISKKEICLGKMVNGYKTTKIDGDSIESIELIHEVKTEFRAAEIYTGGDVEVHSNYYQIYLKDNSYIRFDNLYDRQLQNDLKHFCLDNNIEITLDVKKIIKGNND